jgi:hypothetical protein
VREAGLAGVIVLAAILTSTSLGCHRAEPPPPTASPAEVVLALDLPTPPAAPAVPPASSPLLQDLLGPPPTAVAEQAPPGVLDEQRLLGAVRAALPALGGRATAAWAKPTAVGGVLQVRWAPGEPLPTPEAVQEAVVAAVGTVVDVLDREFPRGFRGSDGLPLAAVAVDLPDQDTVVVAVRTYRALVAGELALADLPGQWRLLRRALPTEAARASGPRLVPDHPSEGAPERWPPRIARWYPEILAAARRYQLDPDLLAAIMQQESGGEPLAVGAWVWIPHMGRYERAIGMMQVMPNEAERRGWTIEQAWEPEQNILLGARVLRDKLDSVPGDFWTRVQGYYGFGDPLSDYWLDRVYTYWLAFRDPAPQ